MAPARLAAAAAHQGSASVRRIGIAAGTTSTASPAVGLRSSWTGTVAAPPGPAICLPPLRTAARLESPPWQAAAARFRGRQWSGAAHEGAPARSPESLTGAQPRPYSCVIHGIISRENGTDLMSSDLLGPTQVLADFVANASWDRIPAPVQDRVRGIVMDTIAAALGGHDALETRWSCQPPSCCWEVARRRSSAAVACRRPRRPWPTATSSRRSTFATSTIQRCVT